MNKKFEISLTIDYSLNINKMYRKSDKYLAKKKRF